MVAHYPGDAESAEIHVTLMAPVGTFADAAPLLDELNSRFRHVNVERWDLVPPAAGGLDPVVVISLTASAVFAKRFIELLAEDTYRALRAAILRLRDHAAATAPGRRWAVGLRFGTHAFYFQEELGDEQFVRRLLAARKVVESGPEDLLVFDEGLREMEPGWYWDHTEDSWRPSPLLARAIAGNPMAGIESRPAFEETSVPERESMPARPGPRRLLPTATATSWVRWLLLAVGLVLVATSIIIAAVSPDAAIVAAFLGAGVVLLVVSANPEAPQELAIGPASAKWKLAVFDEFTRTEPDAVGPDEADHGVPEIGDGPGMGAVTRPSLEELRQMAITASTPEEFAQVIAWAAEQRGRKAKQRPPGGEGTA